MSCDESLFSDNDSVRVGCSNDNAMATIGEFDVTHKNSVRKKKKTTRNMHYQENTILQGTTELQCLGEIRGRVRTNGDVAAESGNGQRGDFP